MLVLSSVSPFGKYFILFAYLSLCICVLLMNLCARYSMYVELRGRLIGISSLYGLQELNTRQPGLVGLRNISPVHFILFIQSRTPDHRMVLFVFRVVSPLNSTFLETFSELLFHGDYKSSWVDNGYPSQCVSDFLCCFLWAHAFD